MCAGVEMNCLSEGSMVLNQGGPLSVDVLPFDADDESAKQESVAAWTIDQTAFVELLSWLAPDPEVAGQQYELIRQRLIALFRCRACAFPEDLADETINRVIRKLPQIKPGYVGNPIYYFYGVAKRVYLEYLRPTTVQKPLPAPPDKEESEAMLQHLDAALDRLAPADRELILSYYQSKGHNKVQHRKALASQLGINLNTLRLRVYRIRSQLRSDIRARQ